MREIFSHELVSHAQHATSAICALQKVLRGGAKLCSSEHCMFCVPSLSLFHLVGVRYSHWLYPFKAAMYHEGSERRISMPKNSELYVPLLSVIPGWAFSYFSDTSHKTCL